MPELARKVVDGTEARPDLKTIEALEQHGLIDPGFFNRLMTARPGQTTRILAVAKFKTDHPEHLDHPCEVQGQQITVARYLDLVAAGQFTDKEETP